MKSNEYKDAVGKIREKSSELLDSRIYTISAGGIAILMALFTQIESHSEVWLFILSIVCFLVALITNLLSHLDVINRIDKILDSGVTSIEKINRENKGITKVNICSIVFILLGIISALIFIAFD